MATQVEEPKVQSGCHSGPWYSPLLWPVQNIMTASKVDPKTEPKRAMPLAGGYLDLFGNMTSMCAALRSFGLAYLCVYYIHGGEDGFGYPAFGAAKTLNVEWMWPLLVRNLIGTWLVAGLWDWFLHFSPFADKMKPFKLNEVTPSMSQLKHDSFWTTMASI